MPDRDYVERKCAQLVEAGSWPREQELRYRGWLNNFAGDDLGAAITLLDHFVFINPEHASWAVLDGYMRFLGHLHDERYGPTPRETKRLAAIHNEVHFTGVRGESPNPTDSGNAYARIAREDLAVSENRIHEFPAAIGVCARGKPLVLVDDFSGTGNQIMNTLAMKDGAGRSLRELLRHADATVCCITAVMTSYAMGRLAEAVPSLQLFPGYTAPENEYSVDALLPKDQYASVHQLITHCAPRFSTPGMDQVRGANGLGLLLGVHDRIPDASLPIFWADGGDGWIPLKPRRG